MANLTKKEAQFRHFRSRLFQRYGIYATEEVVDDVVKQIQNGESEPVLTQSNTRTHHAVDINGTRVVVVYDKSRGMPITAIPPEGLSQYESLD